VLEDGPLPTRYFLSSKAASGILRRAEARGNASISLKANGRQPRGSKATEAASMPEQIERYFIGQSFRE